MHPAGDRAAFVVNQMDLSDDWYVTAIWQWDGTAAAQYTAGPADTAPRWSPDGSQLAFLRAAKPEEPPQVAVMPANGGEPVVLTESQTEYPLGPHLEYLMDPTAEYTIDQVSSPAFDGRFKPGTSKMPGIR